MASEVLLYIDPHAPGIMSTTPSVRGLSMPELVVLPQGQQQQQQMMPAARFTPVSAPYHSSWLSRASFVPVGDGFVNLPLQFGAASPSPSNISPPATTVSPPGSRVCEPSAPAPVQPPPQQTKRPGSSVREAQWAGKRYPSKPTVLADTVMNYLSSGIESPGARLVVVPHAKMDTAGAVVAAGMFTIPVSTETVVLIGPSHKRGAPTCAVSAFGAMETPIGVSEVDMGTCNVYRSSKLFEPMPVVADLEEYSVESLLPYLQLIAPNAKIVPIYVNNCPREQVKSRAKLIAKTLKANKRAVVVATCDFGLWGEKYGWTRIDPEFGPGEAGIRGTIAKQDMRLIDLISSADASLVSKSPLGASICGHSGLSLALYAARYAGWKLRPQLMAHGVATGSGNSFQGQASIAFFKA
eukprot:m51a1_g4186 hypothetical protein (410) ;mRNA; r:378694-380321